ncbi:pantetheine-phosphate adenylyltransferase [Candidatus Vesicomyidisocius sp. SY067_SCS001]|uniref:pantetheine-phosphate adenylyltransferase n=1 Tax=Candidatus Vesicomyidisocius sp. SY067_SCS001 TaxID=2732590 RepID=UPI001685D2E5|nr:pantetheine-phosphate adenylyltransferase [Candidatus Vesicomyosocius sp. SY067_SCS001]
MKKIAIYPGSFDPITNGHVDLIKRASKLFDKIIIGVAQNSKKKAFLSINDRIDTITTALEDINNIRILSFDTLLVDFASLQNAQVILRGLRTISDFEYEYQLSGINKHLNPNIETLFITPTEQYANVSSSLIKEIIALKGDINVFVPASVKTLLKHRL